KDANGLGPRDPGTIGTIGQERLETIGDRDDAHLQGDLFGPETVGVPRPVEALVMVPHDRQESREPLEAPQDLLAEERVALEHGSLLSGELALLGEERRGKSRVADVLEEGTESDGHARGVVQAECPSDLDRARRDSLAVPLARAIVRGDRGCQDDERLGAGLEVGIQPTLANDEIDDASELPVD